MTVKRLHSLLSNEEQELIKLIGTISKRYSWETKNHLIQRAQLKKKKDAKRTKFFQKIDSKRKKHKYEERMKIPLLPLLLSQALTQGIPLREPNRKKGSREEPQQLLVDVQEKFISSQEFKQFIKENELFAENDLVEELPLNDLQFIPDKMYLQRIDADNTKILVKMFVDWGYLSEDKTPLFVDDKGNELAYCLIHVSDIENKSVSVYPLLHRSHYFSDAEQTADSLFIGMISRLKPDTKYKYRIECYKKDCSTLFAGTKFFEFRTSFNLDEKNKPFFFSVSSDLHGGRGGGFLRGKVEAAIPKGNTDLGRVFRCLAATEQKVTFGEGYSLAVATGDLIENAFYSEYWSDLFTRCSPLWNHVPLLTAIGNHDYYTGGTGRGHVLGGSEEDCRYWHKYITNPVTGPGVLPGHWYSIDQGNVHMIFLDTNGTGWGKYEIDCKSAQWHWLENDLKTWREKLDRGEKAPEICLVFFHSAIISCGFWGQGFDWGNDEKVQSYLTPLFRKYGVRMVIFGHDHIYQRTKWMDTHYLVNGRHGGTMRPDFFFLRNRALFDINRSSNNRTTRVYTTLFVPPNSKHYADEEQNEFNLFKQKIRAQLLNEPTSSFFFFGLRRNNVQIGRIFDKHKVKKEKLIDDFVLSKLNTHLWLRSFAVELHSKPEEREIFDMAFIRMSPVDTQDKHYIFSCPEKVVN